MNNQTISTRADMSMLETREFVLDVPILVHGQSRQACRPLTPVALTLRVDRSTGLVYDFQLRVGSPRSKGGNEGLARKKVSINGNEGSNIGGAHRAVSAQEWGGAKLRHAYVKAALEVPHTRESLEHVVRKVWANLGRPEGPPHWATVRRWCKRYIASGSDFSVLVAQRRKRLVGNFEPHLGTERG